MTLPYPFCFTSLIRSTVENSTILKGFFVTNAVFEKKMRKQHKLFDLNRMKRLFKEGLWVILGKMAAVSGALVLVRVLTG